MKYVTTSNIQLYDELIKKYIDSEFGNQEDMLTYGIEWEDSLNPDVKRIGNLEFHKSLPIQSQLKGCIAQGNKIMYWLNEDDWRFRKDTEGFVLRNQQMGVQLTDPYLLSKGDEGYDPDNSVVEFSITNDLFSDQRYKNQYVRLKSEIDETVEWQPQKIISIDTETKTARCRGIFPKNTALITLLKLEIGSVLNGYDGTVRIYCPTFYIKSSSENGVNKVQISSIKLDETWYEQKHCLIDAYRCTILRSVPENMGYLSNLPINSLVSICNTETYCRGCANDATKDQYLETDQFKTDLGKSVCTISPSQAFNYLPNTNSHEITYNQYKNILYWLWVIEYGSFNTRTNFNPNLTDEGYRQGGLGKGFENITSSILKNYNGNYPLIPCGLLNEFGNNTGSKIVSITFDSTPQTFTLTRWRGFDCLFQDSYTWLQCIVTKFYKDHNDIYMWDDPTEKWDDVSNKEYFGRTDTAQKLVLKYKLGDKADVICDTSVGYSSNINQGMCALYSSKVADTTSETTYTNFFAAGGYNSSDLSSIMSMIIAYSYTYGSYLIGFRSVSDLD